MRGSPNGGVVQMWGGDLDWVSLRPNDNELDR